MGGGIPVNVPTGLELTDLSTKWGLVTVVNVDGSINRQFAIPATEASGIASGTVKKPVACTDAEWDTGLVIVTTRPCKPGQAVACPDGSLVVNYGVVQSAGSVVVSLMRLTPSEWEFTGGMLCIDSSLKAQLDVPHTDVVI